MSGLVFPSPASIYPDNVGIDNQVKMGPAAMLLMVPPAAKWTTTNELTFLTYALAQMIALPPNRWYPLLGKYAPVRSIDDAKEADVLQNFDDGSTAFVRSGMFARTFMTNKGGLNFAKALRSFNGQDWGFIEICRNGLNQLLVNRMVNNDGTLSGIPANLAYAPTPKLATLKEVFEVSFYLNFSPDNYISYAQIMATTDDLLGSLTGLIDVQLIASGTQSVTALNFKVVTTGSQQDITTSGMAAVGNFVVTEVDNGTVITPSAASLSNSVITLTGTYVSGKNYQVTGAAPSVWNALTLPISGYEVTTPVIITIP